MSEPNPRNPPLPIAHAVIVCQEIWQDARTGTPIVVGPRSAWTPLHFPVHVRLSLMLEFTGGHGSYLPRMVLRDDTDEVVWGWGDPRPFEQRDPLAPSQVSFHDLQVAVPHPGCYQLQLLLNGDPVAQVSHVM